MPLTVEACYLLRPQGPLRFGAHPDDLTSARGFPASDTLFGALMWAAQVADGAQVAAEWVERFRSGDPPVLLSSALPYLERERTPLVPRPQRRPAFDEDSYGRNDWDPKALKRAEYVELPLLSLWRSGLPKQSPVALDEALVTADLATRLAARAGRPAEPSPRTAIWRTASRPGVALDRSTSASQVYSYAATSYGCALAVYVLAESVGALSRLDRWFNVLARTGIGGRRSRGLGAFSWERIASPLPLSPAPKGLALSLVWPRRDELEAGALSPPDGLGYRIIDRRGWIASPPWSTERTRTVAMLGEGSYVNPKLRPVVGGLADVTPPNHQGRHPVFRCGLGLFLDEERLS